MNRSPKAQLAAEIGGYTHDPYGHALFAYPWGEGPLQGLSGPRRWQREVLREIGDHLSNPATQFQPLRIAIATGHGPGKTGLMGMIAKWGLDTMPDTRVVLTANTDGQLQTKTMPEVLKWNGLAVTKDWFNPSVTRIESRLKGHTHSWRLDATPWSQHSPEAFAGLHNKGRRIIVGFDEASNIHDKIWEVTEGALTDEDTEIIWLAFGNGTRNRGRFKECFGRYRHLWSTRNIDSRTVEGTNRQYLDEMVTEYGEDSDIVKVRVRGLFPSQSSLTFISTDVVDRARQRSVEQGVILSSDPVIFGLDHARFGSDSTILAIRQGRDARSTPWKTWHGANSMEIAGELVSCAQQYHPDAIFIDAGGPNAGGVIDRARQLMGMEAPIFEINFGSSSRDMQARGNGEQRVRVANKRAQMWTNMRTWLERGAIPDDQTLADDLTGVEYSYNADSAILLEKKEHMKARGLASCDRADALALTFAEDVLKREPDYLNPDHYRREKPYDRYAELDQPYERA